MEGTKIGDLTYYGTDFAQPISQDKLNEYDRMARGIRAIRITPGHSSSECALMIGGIGAFKCNDDKTLLYRSADGTDVTPEYVYCMAAFTAAIYGREEALSYIHEVYGEIQKHMKKVSQS